ncbi:MFS general substrate transporter [Coprinellus micaceus]|uniref:MFS general substrate transporter n=1 Tax=Coprinellus micaceus TaxID=71717 RepID=A0A4Y7SMR4_COPMI|nr:MFS general substrate transporter [Coprinellus micaceus]
MDSCGKERAIIESPVEEKASSLISSSSVPIPPVPVIDPLAEKRLVKKLDWILLPLFTSIYVCNFIDRTSIGNAKVAGLENDLGMHGAQLNVALTIFYIFYVIADIPSNLMLKQFGSIWLAFLVIGFGLVSLFSAFLHNNAGLIASRVFLGLTEGGTLAGLIYVMSRYYRKHELVLRVGIFFGIGPSIAGAFGGLLASGLLKLQDMGSVKTWRKVFLVEGLITTIFGLVLLFIVPEDPSKSKILNEEERKLAMQRIDAEQIIKSQGQKEKTTLKLVLRSFNLMTTSCTLCFVLLNMSFQGLSLFLPSVIRSLGTYSTIEVQLRTVPPYLASAAWVIVNAYISQRLRLRFLPLLYNVLIVVVGYTISVTSHNSQARYAACFLMIMGGSVGGPMLVTWATDNAAPDTMRAVVTAAVPGIGAFGAVMAVWTYAPGDAPDYRKGNLANLSCCSAIVVIVSLTALYVRWENKKRERGERDHRVEGKTEDELRNLGYKHPQFRYQI